MAPRDAIHLMLLMLPAAYLVGCVPFGLIVGRAKGVDVRAAGSGNIGATNVARLLGSGWGYFVFFLDALKGFLPTAAASWVAHRVPAADRTAGLYALWLAVGAMAFVGHCFSAFLKFKGGKGVSTSVGICLGYIPYLTYPGLVGLVAFAAAAKGTRYISVGSLLASAAVPAAYVAIGLALGWDVFGRQLPVLLLTLCLTIGIWIKHRANLVRLFNGTESPIKPRAKRSAEPG